MTLTDISRLLKIAAVPRSKTVQCGYPNPCIVVHVDASHFAVVREVVNRMRLPSDDINVTLLESRDVGEHEHVYVKWKGDNNVSGWSAFDDAPPDYQRKTRRNRQTAANRNVVLELASVVVQ